MVSNGWRLDWYRDQFWALLYHRVLFVRGPKNHPTFILKLWVSRGWSYWVYLSWEDLKL
jgi:hypothetical protein